MNGLHIRFAPHPFRRARKHSRATVKAVEIRFFRENREAMYLRVFLGRQQVKVNWKFHAG